LKLCFILSLRCLSLLTSCPSHYLDHQKNNDNDDLLQSQKKFVAHVITSTKCFYISELPLYIHVYIHI
jgi:hypothetical protein